MEVCGKMVRNVMGPGLQFSVSRNSQIFNFQDKTEGFEGNFSYIEI